MTSNRLNAGTPPGYSFYRGNINVTHINFFIYSFGVLFIFYFPFFFFHIKKQKNKIKNNSMRLTLTFCLLVSFNIVSGLFSVPTAINENNAGHLGFAGSYAGISNVNSIQQFQSTTEDSIVLRNNSNTLERISSLQGNITSSCVFQNSVYFGGYFETVNQTYPAHHIVKFDTQTNQFQSLNEGLNGPVYSLYCDALDQILYVGGNFSSPIDTNSTMSNVAAWNIRNSSWALLPWKGFNGPVYTITKNIKYNTILFGGHFDATGDGQFFNSNTSQLVPLNSPTVRSYILSVIYLLIYPYSYSLYLQEMVLIKLIQKVSFVLLRYQMLNLGICKMVSLAIGMQISLILWCQLYLDYLIPILKKEQFHSSKLILLVLSTPPPFSNTTKKCTCIRLEPILQLVLCRPCYTTDNCLRKRLHIIQRYISRLYCRRSYYNYWYSNQHKQLVWIQRWTGLCSDIPIRYMIN